MPSNKNDEKLTDKNIEEERNILDINKVKYKTKENEKLQNKNSKKELEIPNSDNVINKSNDDKEFMPKNYLEVKDRENTFKNSKIQQKKKSKDLISPEIDQITNISRKPNNLSPNAYENLDSRYEKKLKQSSKLTSDNLIPIFNDKHGTKCPIEPLRELDNAMTGASGKYKNWDQTTEIFFESFKSKVSEHLIDQMRHFIKWYISGFTETLLKEVGLINPEIELFELIQKYLLLNTLETVLHFDNHSYNLNSPKIQNIFSISGLSKSNENFTILRNCQTRAAYRVSPHYNTFVDFITNKHPKNCILVPSSNSKSVSVRNIPNATLFVQFALKLKDIVFEVGFTTLDGARIDVLTGFRASNSSDNVMEFAFRHEEKGKYTISFNNLQSVFTDKT
ncbi:MAG: hypothetical protein MHPSP_000105, partial [Paramarteilia canceri]